jgi:hypothetical protein
MMTAKQRYGLKREEWAMGELQRLGHNVRLISNFFDDFDLIVDDSLPVEVKAARVHARPVRPGYYRPTYTFDVSNINQDYDYVVILICEEPNALKWPYIVPSWLLQSRSSTSITSHPRSYNGQWAKYLNCWHTINQVKQVRKRLNQTLQLSFWDNFNGQSRIKETVSQKEGVYSVPS